MSADPNLVENLDTLRHAITAYLTNRKNNATRYDQIADSAANGLGDPNVSINDSSRELLGLHSLVNHVNGELRHFNQQECRAKREADDKLRKHNLKAAIHHQQHVASCRKSNYATKKNDEARFRQDENAKRRMQYNQQAIDKSKQLRQSNKAKGDCISPYSADDRPKSRMASTRNTQQYTPSPATLAKGLAPSGTARRPAPPSAQKQKPGAGALPRNLAQLDKSGLPKAKWPTSSDTLRPDGSQALVRPWRITVEMDQVPDLGETSSAASVTSEMPYSHLENRASSRTFSDRSDMSPESKTSIGYISGHHHGRKNYSTADISQRDSTLSQHSNASASSVHYISTDKHAIRLRSQTSVTSGNHVDNVVEDVIAPSKTTVQHEARPTYGTYDLDITETIMATQAPAQHATPGVIIEEFVRPTRLAEQHEARPTYATYDLDIVETVVASSVSQQHSTPSRTVLTDRWSHSGLQSASMGAHTQVHATYSYYDLPHGEDTDLADAETISLAGGAVDSIVNSVLCLDTLDYEDDDPMLSTRMSVASAASQTDFDPPPPRQERPFGSWDRGFDNSFKYLAQLHSKRSETEHNSGPRNSNLAIEQASAATVFDMRESTSELPPARTTRSYQDPIINKSDFEFDQAIQTEPSDRWSDKAVLDLLAGAPPDSSLRSPSTEDAEITVGSTTVAKNSLGTATVETDPEELAPYIANAADDRPNALSVFKTGDVTARASVEGVVGTVSRESRTMVLAQLEDLIGLTISTAIIPVTNRQASVLIEDGNVEEPEPNTVVETQSQAAAVSDEEEV